MNDPYLEPSEQIDIVFPSSPNKIKFYIFKNISKWPIQVLRPFQYNNTCGLCDDILDKYKKGRFMVNKCFVFHEEVIDVFYAKYYIPTIEKLLFHLAHVRILGLMECGKTRND